MSIEEWWAVFRDDGQSMYQRAIEKIKLVNFAIQLIEAVYNYTDLSLNN